MRYINKSVFIEAVQFNGRNLDDIQEFVECSNVQSATILNNVLYLIVKTYEKAEFERWTVMPNDYLVKDASGYVTSIEEDILKTGWIPFNYSK
jgi:hypothetical protein